MTTVKFRSLFLLVTICSSFVGSSARADDVSEECSETMQEIAKECGEGAQEEVPGMMSAFGAMRKECKEFRECKQDCVADKKDCKGDAREELRECKAKCKTKPQGQRSECRKACRREMKSDKRECAEAKRKCHKTCKGKQRKECKEAKNAFWDGIWNAFESCAGAIASNAPAIVTECIAPALDGE